MWKHRHFQITERCRWRYGAWQRRRHSHASSGPIERTDPRHRTHERQRWEQKENGLERRGKGVRCWRQPPRGSASFPGAPCGPETMARKNGPVPPGRFTKLISLFQGQQRRQENGQTRRELSAFRFAKWGNKFNKTKQNGGIYYYDLTKWWHLLLPPLHKNKDNLKGAFPKKGLILN